MSSTPSIETLQAKIDELQRSIEELRSKQRIKVRFQVKKTDSGIELSGGPTTIEKTGTLIGTAIVPSPQQNAMMLGAVVVDENGVAGVVGPIETLKFEL